MPRSRPGEEPEPPAHETAMEELSGDPLLTPSEVASLFRVSAKTVSRWEQMGRIKAIRTLGGHRRFRRSEVAAAMDSAAEERRDE